MNVIEKFYDVFLRISKDEKGIENFDNVISKVMTYRKIGVGGAGYMMEHVLAALVNKYSNNVACRVVGKEFYRNSSENEDDIIVFDRFIEEEERNTIINNRDFKKMNGISLKTYGDKGPLQISTNKSNSIRTACESYGENDLSKDQIKKLLSSDAFVKLSNINTMHILYEEPDNKKNGKKKSKKKSDVYSYRITYFDIKTAIKNIVTVKYSNKNKYSVYNFYDQHNEFVFEVRYGGKSANSFQRGIWTNTNKVSSRYLKELISYRKYNGSSEELGRNIDNIIKEF